MRLFSMQRYWVPRERFAGDRAVLLDEDAHHAVRVMRLRAGDAWSSATARAACGG
ncbi:RNA methyltransferase PUA domain-containing protein, partial [Calditerricola satsumensis]|uniref:RNA methyltransferase PUA domain-containing protein n=1 Tax=Calditerricola satsumensis TaxID=373054 RepID=UPI0035715E1A